MPWKRIKIHSVFFSSGCALKCLLCTLTQFYSLHHYISERNVALFTPLHTLIWLLILYIDILHHANTVIVYCWVLKDHQFKCSRPLLVMKYLNNAVLILEVTWRLCIRIPHWFQYIHSRGQQETSNVALASRRVCLV